MKDLSFRGPPSLAIAENATTPNPGINGVTIWSTSSLKTLYWDSAKVKWLAIRSGSLTSYDNRALKPNNLDIGSIAAYFSSKTGMEGGALAAPYLDVIGFNSYNDASGGGVNALAFNKTSQALYHYYGSFNGATWNTPKQIAYTDSNITGSAATLTTPRKINDISFDGSADVVLNTLYDTGFKRITNPGDGIYTISGNATGALTITFPTLFTSTMIRVTVKVYEYTTNKSFDITFGGYIYANAGGSWVNAFAYINGNPNIDRQLTVRFGKTAAGKPVVYIGELATVWSYPQVFITEVQAGLSGQTIGLTTGWTIGPTTTAFETVSATISNPQIGYQSSANTPNSVVFRDASGNFAANSITVSAGFNSVNIISFLNATAAQGIKVGSLVIDSTYSTNAPTNGLYVRGVLQSGVATGTAPLLIASTTRVANLNVDRSALADTATVLQNARTINGVNFDGSANITLTAVCPYILTAGSYITGTSYNGSAAVTFAVDATNAATANKVVARDASGNTAVNELASTAIKLNSIVTNSTATVTTATVNQTVLLSLPISTYAGIKIIIQATRGGERHITELLVLHNGTTATATEYGSIITSSKLFDTDVDIFGGNIRIIIASSSATSTAYKASYTAITI